ncbi:MAG: nucleotide-binding protein [Nitrososphaeraceae archaeon]|nr:nucleotide-binding protein [Nitrososphaeraceae archaeon]
MSEFLHLGLREKFISAARKSNILARECQNCKSIMLETTIYCNKCQGDKFNLVEYTGIGKVNTFTIHTVPPEGFDDVESYAWVVFTLDQVPLRVSGFLPGIKFPSELPLGSKVKVIGFDERHGLLLEKL